MFSNSFQCIGCKEDTACALRYEKAAHEVVELYLVCLGLCVGMYYASRPDIVQIVHQL